jgi:hypothetical protein
MCLPKAEKDFRFFVQKISDEQSPRDGFAFNRRLSKFVCQRSRIFSSRNGYSGDAQHGNGFETVSENLKAWLEEATQMGSGDDSTVAIIYRPDALKEPETSPKAETKEAEKSASPGRFQNCSHANRFRVGNA